MDKTIWQHILTPLLLLIFFIIAIFGVVKMTVNIKNSPKLVIKGPTDIITSSENVIITGTADPKATLSVDGATVPIDKDGNFTYTVATKEGEQKINFVLEKWYSTNSKIVNVKKEIAQETKGFSAQNTFISKAALSDSGPSYGLFGALGATAIIVASLWYMKSLNTHNENFGYRLFTKG